MHKQPFQLFSNPLCSHPLPTHYENKFPPKRGNWSTGVICMTPRFSVFPGAPPIFSSLLFCPNENQQTKKNLGIPNCARENIPLIPKMPLLTWTRKAVRVCPQSAFQQLLVGSITEGWAIATDTAENTFLPSVTKDNTLSRQWVWNVRLIPAKSAFQKRHWCNVPCVVALEQEADSAEYFSNPHIFSKQNNFNWHLTHLFLFLYKKSYK